MTIKFDKNLYDKDSIYSSAHIWSEYFDSLKLEDTKKFILVSMNDTDNIHSLCAEFCNFVLDTVSSKEIGK